VGNPATSPEVLQAELLRLSTAGSVDDGKSTLLGRLLYETKEIFEDQLQAVERASLSHGGDYVNLALLTDGLRAEREQGITIDVAYRHFATARRRFILADTPGHVQYTRNMVTGTSTADLTIVLLDARKGVVEQTRRHLFIASMLRVPHVLICVNKMDLVGYDRAVFEQIRADLTPLLAELSIVETTCIPVSALIGDNVVERSDAMSWYEGPTLLEHLETVSPGATSGSVGLRFPVQWVVRPLTSEYHDYRGYAGQLASGALHPGDEVLVLPSRLRNRIASIDTFNGPIAEAVAPMSVSVTLEEHVDISRGDMLADPLDPPRLAQEFEATICWLTSTPMRAGGRYAIKHTTHSTKAQLQSLDYRVDIASYAHDSTADSLVLNEIGNVRIRTLAPLICDPYARNRTTGSFILIDEGTNETVAAGVLA
jgi:bifunctional enzyme CysN/CysC